MIAQKKGPIRKGPTPNLSGCFLFDLQFVEKVDRLGVPVYDLAGCLVFLLDNDERPDGLFAFADDIAVKEPLPECQAILFRVVPLGFFFTPTLRDLLMDKFEGVF